MTTLVARPVAGLPAPRNGSRDRGPGALGLSMVAVTMLLAILATPRARAAETPPSSPAKSAAVTPASDPRAIRIADEVMKALGGKQRWDDLPGLRWNYGAIVNDTVRSNRRHAWNKLTGWHRVDYRSAAGDTTCIIHKVGTTQGMAKVNGNAIAGDSLLKLIARGERIWINDTYWMLMPYKMRDAGVTLRYDSEKVMDGKPCDVLSMTFDHVGQTPGDHYWVYVNRANHRVEHWEMVLQSDQPPPEAYSWDDWVETGGLWFPTAHRQPRTNIFTRGVVAVTSFPAGEFTTP